MLSGLVRQQRGFDLRPFEQHRLVVRQNFEEFNAILNNTAYIDPDTPTQIASKNNAFVPIGGIVRNRLGNVGLAGGTVFAGHAGNLYSLPVQSSPQGPFTAMAWVRPTSSQTNAGIYAHRSESNPTEAALDFSFSQSTANTPSLRVSTDTSNYIAVDGTASVANDIWTHVAATWDGTTSDTSSMKLYINGVDVTGTGGSIGTFTGMPAASNVKPLIGAKGWGDQAGQSAGPSMSGPLDDVRLYHRMMSIGEIKAIAAAPFQPPLGIESFWIDLGRNSQEAIRPDADNTDGTWVTDTGGTSLFAAIDEAPPPNDSDYIRSATDPVNDLCKIGLGNFVGTPAEPMSVHFRYSKGGTDATIDLRVRLLQGTTEIASWTYTSIAAGFVDRAESLSTAQFNSISDFTDLFLEFRANKP